MRFRVCCFHISRSPPGATKPDAQFVAPAPRANRVVQQVVVDLKICPDRIPVRQRLAHAENYRLVVSLFLERAEQPVPQNEYATIILVDIALVLRMMYAVVRRRDQDTIQDAQPAYELCVHPELVDQVDGANREQHLKRESDDEQGQIKDPAKQETGTGLPLRG